MQSLNWYIRRFRAMEPREAAWRLRCAVRDAVDRPLVGLRRRPRPLRVLLDGLPRDSYGFAVTDMDPGEWTRAAAGPQERQWRSRLLERADRMAAGRLSFFDQDDLDCGQPIDWNRDHKADIRAPLRFSPWLDYRDTRSVGDCKFVWEPNRHQHFVVLARAYRASGDARYARALVQQWISWLDQCPYGVGMNWRSPLELAIRLINWVWAFDMVRPSGLIDQALQERLLNSVHLHLWEISRKHARGSSANNHIVGEAAGVFIAASYFRQLKQADHWRGHGYRILCEQIHEQTFADGANREQATGYHLFVLQFLLLAGLVGQWTGYAFPASYWSTLQKQFDFVVALHEGGDCLPMIGDADDGYVLDLGHDAADLQGWLAAGAVVLDRPDLRTLAGQYAEAARWLLGRCSRERFDAIPPLAAETPLASRAFPESGLYLLQSGHLGNADRISVTFDCGQLGLGAIAAHGHADALSITLRAFGADVLVDPGTYDYFTYPAWREFFRSTRGHNTVVIDDQDQSVMQGLFLWGTRANARCLAWQPEPTGGTVRGEHDGYTRLTDPVIHRRTVALDGASRQVNIHDEIQAAGPHSVAICFHLAEQCRLKTLEPNVFAIDTGRGIVTLGLDRRLSVRIDSGNSKPIVGWVSRRYHRKIPAVTLTGQCQCSGTIQLQCRLTVGIQ